MDTFRKNLNKYTRKAFELIPKIDKPDILDIGCGSGVETIELASLTNGQITAIDIDEAGLEKLSAKINELALQNKIKVIKMSMFDLAFTDESFNIIWAEGSIYAIGFKNGIEKWRRLLKPNGYLVVHDEMTGLPDKIVQIPLLGYKLIDYFILSHEIWWNEYYKPIEEYINKLRLKPDFKLEEEHIKNIEEIEMFKKNPEKCQSVYFIMRKN